MLIPLHLHGHHRPSLYFLLLVELETDLKVNTSTLCISLTSVYEAHVDSANKIVTTPAFMCETAVHEVYDGIGEMIEHVLKLTKSTK